MSKISDIEVFDIGIHRYRSQNFDIEVKTSISVILISKLVASISAKTSILVYTDIEDFDIGNFAH